MSKAVVVSVAVFGLVGCGSVPMFVDMGNDQTLRGSASGRVGSMATFSVTDIMSDLSCTGMFPFNMEKLVTGTMQCSDGLTGKYLMNRNDRPSWRGEGKMENGKKFRIFINYSTDPDKR